MLLALELVVKAAAMAMVGMVMEIMAVVMVR